jgi:high frequency lysogenization protein
MKDRTLALAGVFQATELVRQAACHGTWSGYAATACLQSLFSRDSESVESVYGGVSRMRLGIETMLAVLGGESRHMDSLRYAISVLQVQRKFKRARSMQEEIGVALDRIAGTGDELEEHEQEDRQALEISELYQNTISNLSPRIVINGVPQYLTNDRTVSWVRTLLLAGVRSAVLWDQMGGGRFDLMFGRKRIINEAQSLLTS